MRRTESRSPARHAEPTAGQDFAGRPTFCAADGIEKSRSASGIYGRAGLRGGGRRFVPRTESRSPARHAEPTAGQDFAGRTASRAAGGIRSPARRAGPTAGQDFAERPTFCAADGIEKSRSASGTYGRAGLCGEADVLCGGRNTEVPLGEPGRLFYWWPTATARTRPGRRSAAAVSLSTSPRLPPCLPLVKSSFIVV